MKVIHTQKLAATKWITGRIPEISKLKVKIRRMAMIGIPVHRGVSKVTGREYANDPGDLGRGVYYDTNLHRARQYGEVTSQQITFSNPLILTNEEAYQLADQYQTVRLSDKRIMEIHNTEGLQGPQLMDFEKKEVLKNAERMTIDLLKKGHDGLIAIRHFPMVDLEIVDYRPFKVKADSSPLDVTTKMDASGTSSSYHPQSHSNTSV